MTQLRKMIETTLEKYPFTRNDDVRLMLYIWREYYSNKVHRLTPDSPTDKQAYVFIKDIPELPREDHVKRLRAIIQNVEGRFLPTDPEVIKQRKINVAKWKDRIQPQIPYKET